MNLENLGVQEMNVKELVYIDGGNGNPFGPGGPGGHNVFDEPEGDGPGGGGGCSCQEFAITTQGSWNNGAMGWWHLLFH